MKDAFSKTAERELNQIKPLALDAEFFERLVGCAENTIENLPYDLRKFEEELSLFLPSRIPLSLDFSIIRTLGETPFAIDEKVVLFNKASIHQSNTGLKKYFPVSQIAVAAVVTFLLTLAALRSPIFQKEERLVKTTSPLSAGASGDWKKDTEMTPASFVSHLKDTYDEGTVWHGNNQPHRVVRMTYMDEATLNQSSGHPVHFKAPRVEYVVVPEKID